MAAKFFLAFAFLTSSIFAQEASTPKPLSSTSDSIMLYVNPAGDLTSQRADGSWTGKELRLVQEAFDLMGVKTRLEPRPPDFMIDSGLTGHEQHGIFGNLSLTLERVGVSPGNIDGKGPYLASRPLSRDGQGIIVSWDEGKAQGSMMVNLWKAFFGNWLVVAFFVLGIVIGSLLFYSAIKSTNRSPKVALRGTLGFALALLMLPPLSALLLDSLGKYKSAEDISNIYRLEDLAGKTVATVAGSTAEKQHLEDVGAETVPCSSIKEVLTRVKNGEVDAGVFDKRIIEHQLRTTFRKDRTLVFVGEESQFEDRVVLFDSSKVTKEFVDRFNRALIALQKD